MRGRNYLARLASIQRERERGVDFIMDDVTMENSISHWWKWRGKGGGGGHVGGYQKTLSYLLVGSSFQIM